MTLKSNEETLVKLSFDNIKERVINSIQRSVATESDMMLFLRAWWCRTYARPYKDPLLLTYTFEELLIEYLDVHYRSNPKALEKETKEAKEQEKKDDEWASKMMKLAEDEDEDFVDDRAEKQKRYKQKMRDEGIEGFEPPSEKPEVEVQEHHLTFGGT